MEPNPLRRPVSTGWFPDPLRRFEFRYFNGERWTADVSVDGTRYVDPSPFSTPMGEQDDRPEREQPTFIRQRHPSRTTATLSFLLGLAGLALAWAPFVFVLGGGGAIAAIILGIVSLRRTARVAATKGIEPAGSRRRLAIAGICIGPLGIGLCIVGVILTGVTYREFNDYVSPGPYQVTESTCALEELRATYSGTITNLDDHRRDYEILLQFLDGTEVVASDRVDVENVAPGGSRNWTSNGRVGEIDLRCRVRNVTGPYPFGIDRGD